MGFLVLETGFDKDFLLLVKSFNNCPNSSLLAGFRFGFGAIRLILFNSFFCGFFTFFILGFIFGSGATTLSKDLGEAFSLGTTGLGKSLGVANGLGIDGAFCCSCCFFNFTVLGGTLGAKVAIFFFAFLPS